MASKQFVVFSLADELYGAEIYDIREIIIPEQPTRIPNNPSFIEGVIDYRGQMIPVLDLKKRFNLGHNDYNDESRFIITDIDNKMAAFAVDEVTEILRLDDENIGEAPEMTKINKEFITGVARVEQLLIVLLNLSKILTVEEKDIIARAIKD